MFQRILIANRGEIAVRVIRACRELGIGSIAVYSDADARAPHVLLADRAVRIGPAPPADSYLSSGAILEAARATGAEAIHPGYGFLSENAAFASACSGAGIVFIGPPAPVIAQLGSKIAARQLAQKARVPIVPGDTPADQSNEAIAVAARRVGLPVLLKPSAGGGGIGMKDVRDERALLPAIEQARREAASAFGDGTLDVERLIDCPRHVEIQILADNHGNVVHLFERECSIQRRHQKVVEETPSTALTPALRQRMGDAAVALARAAGYRNAGTVEFLLEGSGDAASFYFLEVNTRLQVEHPVTEQVTGVDLVRAQIAVAAGDALPWSQRALPAPRCHRRRSKWPPRPALALPPSAGRQSQAMTCPPNLEERTRIRGPRCGGFVVEAIGNGRYRIVSGEQNDLAYAVWDRGSSTALGAGRTWVFIAGRTYVIEGQDRDGRARPQKTDDHLALSAPMPATVLAVTVAPGQDVQTGDVLIRL